MHSATYGKLPLSESFILPETITYKTLETMSIEVSQTSLITVSGGIGLSLQIKATKVLNCSAH